MSEKETKKIVGKECRFAWHVPTKSNAQKDLHIVKEVIHYDDGTKEPNLCFIEDFKRPFWTTKRSLQKTFKQHKEWMHESDLDKHMTTESALRYNVAKALGVAGSRDSLRELAKSPYLFGADVTSTTIVKQLYRDKYSNIKPSHYSICSFDIETDVVNGTNDPILISAVFQNKAIITVAEDYVKNIYDVQREFRQKCDQYIKPYLDKHSLDVELVVCKEGKDMLVEVFRRIHQWQPDFLDIWNMNFDIPKLLEFIKKLKLDPKMILCDPRIPYEQRICRYDEGKDKQVTASGKWKPINPSLRWHTLVCTASFYVIDSMCSFRHIRLGSQEEPSYKLNAILDKILGIRKLDFEQAEGYVELAWHAFMQTNYKVEYIVYNLFDSISLIELDGKTKDLASTLPTFSSSSDFAMFRSQPKRITDELFFYNKANLGLILGCAPPSERKELMPVSSAYEEDEDDEDQIIDEDDIEDKTLDLRNWILTLKAHNQILGLKLIKEDNTLRTNFRAFVYDSDATAAYPTATAVCNVSKETTRREIIRIGNIEETKFRQQNLNLLLGNTNALEYGIEMFNFPNMEQLLSGYNRHRAETKKEKVLH